MGITYQVQSNQDLSSINWHTEEYGIPGTGSEINWFDPSAIDTSIFVQKFYRINVE